MIYEISGSEQEDATRPLDPLIFIAPKRMLFGPNTINPSRAFYHTSLKCTFCLFRHCSMTQDLGSSSSSFLQPGTPSYGDFWTYQGNLFDLYVKKATCRERTYSLSMGYCTFNYSAPL
jgi:hypothetical protein